MTDEKNYIEVYCPLCGNTTVFLLTEPLLLAPGSIISPFEDTWFECESCAATFRIEIRFHQIPDD